ncbi:Fe-S cluster assembly protein SufD [Saccharibacter floricola]|uniref:Fe-S cluster assembly protein SufD n=1 Tax=Saccharibacter floricola TaxID=231053 RepID=UPI000382AABE|nr:Fe-S cluster assembly protein SufD [Saccharibacter floricola]
MSETTQKAWTAFTERAGTRAALLGTQELPTRRVEAWHYTSLQPLNGVAWRTPERLSSARLTALLKPLALPEADGCVVFGNGYEDTDYTKLPASVMREKLDGHVPSEDAALKGRFSAQLNGALRQDGLHLRVPAGVDGGLVVLASVCDGQDVSVHLHHSIVLEEGASLTLLDVQGGEGRYLANPLFDVRCAKGAHFRHVKRQAESKEAFHLGIVSAHSEEHGNYNSFTLNQGGALARHEVVSTLQGPHANSTVNAVQLVDGARLNDLTSLIHHAAPDCTSRQTVRSVLSDAAQGVFQGKILVDQIAQKTDGYQMNQALLLSEKAQINSKPELEIYADDVKCSHGATVGALDEEQLFYLRSRGIPEEQARILLINAFLREAVEMLDDEGLQTYLLRSFPGHE